MKVQVRCDVGYRLQNKFVSSLECTTDGTWIGHNGAFTQEMPVCVGKINDKLTCYTKVFVLMLIFFHLRGDLSTITRSW